ncbi:MAG: SGNH/GDSL hydrolase family protein [Gemmatimonadota bacterium]
MRRITARALSTSLSIVLAVPVLGGCAGADAHHAFDPAAPDTLRVLFVGNSYTYVNNLPEMIERLAAADSLPSVIETGRIAAGGATLERHWEEGRAVDSIRTGRWDVVVLQEQSTLGMRLIDGRPTVNDPATFFDYARRFDREIRRAGARTVLFLPWSRAYSPEHQPALTYAYMTIGRELDATVVPVGLAWRRALDRMPDASLYMSDRSHPAPAGSYLAAATFYAALLDRDPTGLTARVTGRPIPFSGVPADTTGVLVDLPAELASSLQRIARETVRELDARGGYLAVEPPDPPELPAAPPPGDFTETDLEGEWSGPLRLFMVPATMELRVRRDDDGGGGGWTVDWTLTLDGGDSEADAAIHDFSVRDGRIEFTVTGVDMLGDDVAFRGTLAGDGALRGVAELGEPGAMMRAVGSWTLERTRAASPFAGATVRCSHLGPNLRRPPCTTIHRP